ncbi:MAG: SCO family protein [Pseudomonadota bacterium]
MRPLILAAALAACSPAADGPAPTQQSGCATRAYAEIGGPISLIDHTGAARTEADFKGSPSLVYFGFTYCPDVCPLTLATVERAFRRLPEGVTPPRTILISVDPERDSPEAMKAYIETAAFPDDIVGLTGTQEQVRAAATAFKADYTRIEQPESLAEYTMDHTSILYLMDEDWSLKTFFVTHQETDETMAACLADQLS